MTRTHFKAIARIVDNSSLIDDEHINKDELVLGLCEYFSSINDLFNKDLFITACNECNIKDILKHP